MDFSPSHYLFFTASVPIDERHDERLNCESLGISEKIRYFSENEVWTFAVTESRHPALVISFSNIWKNELHFISHFLFCEHGGLRIHISICKTQCLKIYWEKKNIVPYHCTEWVVTSMVEIQLHAVKTSDKAPFKMMLKRLHGNFFKAALNLESTRAGLCRNVSELGTSG